MCSSGECTVSCGGGLEDCDGVCRDLDTDRYNCGDCGIECDEGEVCFWGECEVTCGGGLEDCDGLCRDLDTDRYNCGDCGIECDEGEVCLEGFCDVACGGATPELCDGLCVDTDADRNHCGDCGIECDEGEVCSGGVCGLSCGGATPTRCGDRCVDTDANRNFCGNCATVCDGGEVCSEGECGLSCGGATPTRCGDRCVDLSTDRSYCGDCGMACAAGEVCSEGECGLSCGGATPTRCGSSCVDTATNRAHCSECDAACDSGEVCIDSTCTLSCGGELVSCGGVCTNTDLDPANCGACGDACDLPDAVEFCLGGECGVASCEEGLGDCNDVDADGCEHDVTADPDNCGACDNECAEGAECEDGECSACVLEAPTVTPVQNHLAVPAVSNVVALYGCPIDDATVSRETFLIHGSLSGPHEGAFDLTSPREIVFNPTEYFSPGEQVTAWTSTGLTTPSGTAVEPFCWHFFVAVSDSDAVFTEVWSSVGVENNSEKVALGDLDGDDDLDAFIANVTQPNRVWLNDGAGAFSDSGQSLGSNYSRAVSLGCYRAPQLT